MWTLWKYSGAVRTWTKHCSVLWVGVLGRYYIYLVPSCYVSFCFIIEDLGTIYYYTPHKWSLGVYWFRPVGPSVGPSGPVCGHTILSTHVLRNSCMEILLIFLVFISKKGRIFVGRIPVFSSRVFIQTFLKCIITVSLTFDILWMFGYFICYYLLFIIIIVYILLLFSKNYFSDRIYESDFKKWSVNLWIWTHEK